MRRNKRKRDIHQKTVDVKRKRTDVREIRHVNQRSEDTPHSSHIEMHADGSDVATQREFQQQSENRDCPHCHTHFVSSSAFQFHKKTKTRNQNARTIPFKDYRKSIHHALCPELNCCYSNKNPQLVKVYLTFKYFYVFQLFYLDACKDDSSKKLRRSLHSYIEFDS